VNGTRHKHSHSAPYPYLVRRPHRLEKVLQRLVLEVVRRRVRALRDDDVHRTVLQVPCVRAELEELPARGRLHRVRLRRINPLHDQALRVRGQALDGDDLPREERQRGRLVEVQARAGAAGHLHVPLEPDRGGVHALLPLARAALAADAPAHEHGGLRGDAHGRPVL
jgi:hypothetical protein